MKLLIELTKAQICSGHKLLQQFCIRGQLGIGVLLEVQFELVHLFSHLFVPHCAKQKSM